MGSFPKTYNDPSNLGRGCVKLHRGTVYFWGTNFEPVSRATSEQLMREAAFFVLCTI